MIITPGEFESVEVERLFEVYGVLFDMLPANGQLLAHSIVESIENS